jgi:hypothetical protein
VKQSRTAPIGLIAGAKMPHCSISDLVSNNSKNLLQYQDQGCAGMIEYLRNLAHRCTILARRCSDLSVSQELEGIGAELMEKAHELEKQSDSG